MEKLSAETRRQRALAEAADHVRLHGLDDTADRAYTIAVAWGFEDDEATINTIAQHMKDVFAKKGKLPRVQAPNGRGRARYESLRKAQRQELGNKNR